MCFLREFMVLPLWLAQLRPEPAETQTGGGIVW